VAKVALDRLDAQVLIDVASQLGGGGKRFGTQLTSIRLEVVVASLVGPQVGLSTKTFATFVTVEDFEAFLMVEDVLVEMVDAAASTHKILNQGENVTNRKVWSCSVIFDYLKQNRN